MPDAIEAFCRHVVETDFDALPPPARAAGKTFLLDSLGVGIVGSAAPWVADLIDSQQASLGASSDARVWVRGTPMPAAGAAMCNAFLIHNSEFDCIHEAAVVHPMPVVLGASLAWAERQGGIDGRALLAALVLGVDVATGLGIASNAALKFFRPATAGAFGATAALGKLAGFDAQTLRNAFSATYAQLCGNMQAHTEGSMLLALQIGFNARNAVIACDMAARGLQGPRHLLQGPFGYFPLIEGAYDLEPVLADLGRVWRITETAHKPYPSGRATHGLIDACLSLRQQHGLEAAAIARIEAAVPTLTHGLVGRPTRADMAVSYARLCGPYTMARALLGGSVGVADFAPDRLSDPATLALANRVAIAIDDNSDPNALGPITVTIATSAGATHAITLDAMYGSPERPLSREAHLAKFRGNCAAAAPAVPPDQAERLIALVDGIEDVADVRALVDQTVAP